MNAFSPQVCVHLRTNAAETGVREADAAVKKTRDHRHTAAPSGEHFYLWAQALNLLPPLPV